MSTFIFLSGAWTCARCWERVLLPLRQRGHEPIAPDLLGMGTDKTPLAEVSLSRWTDQITALVERQSEPVILVAHSRGGIVASMVAERVPNRLKRLVYVSGSLIPDGGSIVTHGPKQEPNAPNLLQMHEDGSATLPPDLASHIFLNKTPSKLVAGALTNLVPEPMWVFAETLSLSPSRFGSVRRAYVETLHDKALPIEIQREMQAALPCRPVFTLSTDHSPFYSQPEALADILLSVASTPMTLS